MQMTSRWITLVALMGGMVVSGCAQNLDEGYSAAKNQNADVKQIRLVRELSDSVLLSYAKVNSCYLPLTPQSTYFSKKTGRRLNYSDLLNSTLGPNHPYANRYIVGDFNVLNEDRSVRGIEEQLPKLSELLDFHPVKIQTIEMLERAADEDLPLDTVSKRLAELPSAMKRELLHFYKQVLQYKTPPIKRMYGLIGSTAHAAGQRLCLCEAREDTLVEIARFATSSKRLDPYKVVNESGKEVTKHREWLPVGRGREYYGLHYQISSKNWETQRTYTKSDARHDSLVGGGNTRVTKYKGRIELPNFLLMSPGTGNPSAMRQNGIHEVALRELSRGMLGSPNSIGCIRVSDYGSKFLRWWTPQDANFFILYEEDKYHYAFEKTDISGELPFQSKAEGDAFRKWLNENKPHKAQQLEVGLSGSYNNGYILDAYNLYGAEYEKTKIKK